MPNRQLTIYVDINRCMGCRACETACKLENKLPAGPRYTMVTETEVNDSFERLRFLPMPCQHCGDAMCVRACPTGALHKRGDGIVLSDKKKCIGCHECLMACPFGVPKFGADGLMQKCTMCVHRIDDGDAPACSRACPAEAILFGTVDEISETLRRRYANMAFRTLEIRK